VHQRSPAFRGPGGQLPLRPDDALGLDLLLLVEGETSGRPLAEVLEDFERSRSHYYEKLQRFRAGGVAALLPKPRGPRRPWVRTLRMMQAVVRARLADGTRSAQAIAEDLARGGIAASPRSVERVVAFFFGRAARAVR